MKISFNWLKDYVPVHIKPEELAFRLTMAGHEVEKITTESDDVVFELEITPNRPDCLSILGMAREISAILNKTCKFPKIPILKFPAKKFDITIEDKNDCRQYLGTVIEGCRIAETVEWMKKRIRPLGMRPINNVVDITNFGLMETGQPFHAFDLDKLTGEKIIVRRAKQGEKIVTIDGDERILDTNILVIADAKKPVAIAGIMGGKDTEVTGQTKNILLECAWFDPIIIRRASRKLGLSSDSSYRFERGINADNIEASNKRVVGLILDQSKGKIVSFTKTATVKPKPKKPLAVSVGEINGYLGTAVTMSQCRQSLNRLGFKVSSVKDVLKVVPLGFRLDIKEKVDLIEEMARVTGYDAIPMTSPVIQNNNAKPSNSWRRRNQLRNALCALGLDEVVGYSMTNRKGLERCLQKDLKGITIQNPLTADQEILRPSLLPNLLNAVQVNLNRGQKNLKFFEIGKIYTQGEEKETLGIILTGLRKSDWRELQKLPLDFYDLKGIVEAVLGRVFEESAEFASVSETYLEEGERAAAVIGGKAGGVLGKLSDEVLKNFDIKHQDVYFAQLNIDDLLQEKILLKQYVSLAEFPAIVRDVSLAVKNEITFKDIAKLARDLGGKLLASVTFQEEYLGDKISAGHRGIIFSLSYQSSERTLRDEEVNAVHEKIVASMVSQLGAIRR